MGNYGKFDRFVEQYDPYGTGDQVQDRLKKRAYNQGIYDQAHSGPSVTEQNEARRQKLYDADTENTLADDADMRARGENEYERSLDKRGLLTSDIDYIDPTADPHPDDPNAGHSFLRVRGKVDPARAALLKEAAEQGLLRGGGSPWSNSAQDFAALSKLMEGKKADATMAQTRADTFALADKRIQAMREMRRGDQDAAAAASDRDFGHQAQLFKMKQDAEDTDPTGQLQRQLMEAQIGAQKVGLQRGQDEYLTPQQRSAQAQAQALTSRAQTGDPEAYHALKLLTEGDPKLGISAETYRPSADRVLGQPQIKGELDALGAAVEAAGYDPSPEAIAKVKHHAARAVAAAGDFGPDAQAEVANIVKEHIQRPGMAGTLASLAIPFVGGANAAYRFSHRNAAQDAFADLTNGAQP